MSLFDIRIEGADALNMKFTERRDLAKDLSVPLRRAGVITRDTAVMRIKSGGIPPWIPSKRALKTGGTTGVLTGAMWSGIIPGDPVIVGGHGTISVGVSGPSAIYAKIFQYGYGSRGGKADVQVKRRLKHARAIGWASGGKVYMSRAITYTHTGQPPRPFLYFDDPLTKRIANLFRSHLGLTPATGGM